jgi:hypothetical protein
MRVASAIQNTRRVSWLCLLNTAKSGIFGHVKLVRSRSACRQFAGLFRVGGFVVPRNVLVHLNDLTVFQFQNYP